jgi:uncharacterized protein
MAATVSELFLYPVKSMAGISVSEAHVGLDGILGDRQYAFVRTEQAARNSFPWLTARESASMLLHKPEYRELPTPATPEPPLEIRSPDGSVRKVSDPNLCAELMNSAGHSVFLLRSMRGIFDCQHVSLFSLATVRGLAEQSQSPIDRRQFRANVYLEPDSGRPFDEEEWTDCLLQIGGDVLLAVMQRDLRCMMVNLDPDSVVQNPRVLRTIAQGHQGQAGLYANVVRPGPVRVGDRIVRLPRP